MIPFGVRFVLQVPFGEEIDAYFTRVDGELLCLPTEEEEDPVSAGRLECYIIDVEGAEAQGFHPMDVFDQMQESYECYKRMFEPDSGVLRPEFVAAFGEALSRNVLMLHRLEVLPAFRHAGLGLAAMEQAIRRFGCGCGYAVLQAMPLQFEPRRDAQREQWFAAMQLADFPQDEAQARRKLQSYYARLGFRSIGRTEWMALNLEGGSLGEDW